MAYHWKADDEVSSDKLNRTGGYGEVAVPDSDSATEGYQTLPQLISTVSADGGGTILVRNGTYNFTKDLVIPSGVYLNAESDHGAIFDFGGNVAGVVVEGSDVYNTGTVSCAVGGTTVTGTGTAFSTNVSVGQKILLNDLWYPIITVSSDTSLTIALPLAGLAITDKAYTVATPVENIYLTGIQVQNSAGVGVTAQNANEVYLDDVHVLQCGTAVEYTNTSNNTISGLNSIACQHGAIFNNVHLAIITQTGANNTSVGASLEIRNGCSDIDINSTFLLSQVGAGMVISDSQNISLHDSTIKSSNVNGIDISDSSSITVNNMNISGNGGDAVNLSGNTSAVMISHSNISGNVGWGVNISESTVSGTIISGSTITSNGGGNINDLGTDTRVLETSNVQEFTEDGTWKKPYLGMWAFVEMWGGGGSGAAYSDVDVYASGGGGAQYLSFMLPLMVLSDTEPVTIGLGGASVTSNNSQRRANGNDGGDSKFGLDGVWGVAKGGSKGTVSSTSHNSSGGAGGTGFYNQFKEEAGGASGLSSGTAPSCTFAACGGGSVTNDGNSAGLGGASTYGADGGDAAVGVGGTTTAEDGKGYGAGGGAVGNGANVSTAISGKGIDGFVRITVI